MASRSIFVGSTGQLTQRRDDPVKNGTSGHPSVDSQIDASVSEKRTVSIYIFSPEDGDSVFLRNFGMYRVYTVPKPTKTALSRIRMIIIIMNCM
jgi:hypothetical protein